jgi:ankyrin repeat protein
VDTKRLRFLFFLLFSFFSLSQSLLTAYEHDKKLIRAIENNNLPKFKSRFEGKKPKVNAPDYFGETLLHIAVKSRIPSEEELLGKVVKDPIAIVKYLVEEQKAKIEVKDNYGQTPLLFAVYNEEEEAALYLIGKEAKIDVRTRDNHETALHYAAQNGSVRLTKELLAKNANPNAETQKGETPLHMAAPEIYNDRKVIELLVQKGGDVNLADRSYEKNTPIHIAAAESNAEGMEELLKGHVVDVDKRNGEGFTALQLAVEEVFGIKPSEEAPEGVPEAKKVGYEMLKKEIGLEIGRYMHIADKLLEKGADSNRKMKKRELNYLQASVNLGALELVSLFLKHNARVDEKFPDDRTPLQVAVDNLKNLARASSIDTFLEALGWKFVNVVLAYFGIMPESDQIEQMGERIGDIIKELAKHGANIEVKDAEFEMPPLYHLIKIGNIDLARYFIQTQEDKKKKAKIDYVDNNNDTLLHIAAKKGYSEIIKILLDNGAVKFVNAKNKRNETPLFLAADNIAVSVVDDTYKVDTSSIEHLLNGKADPNIVNNNDVTPLHIAVNRKEGAVASILLFDTFLEKSKVAVEINKKDNKQETVLHKVARRGHYELVKPLIAKHGADVKATNKNGDTPLHIAARGQKANTVLKLMENGAEVDAKNKKWKTPLQLSSPSSDAHAVILSKKNEEKDREILEQIESKLDASPLSGLFQLENLETSFNDLIQIQFDLYTLFEQGHENLWGKSLSKFNELDTRFKNYKENFLNGWKKQAFKELPQQATQSFVSACETIRQKVLDVKYDVKRRKYSHFYGGLELLDFYKEGIFENKIPDESKKKFDGVYDPVVLTLEREFGMRFPGEEISVPAKIKYFFSRPEGKALLYGAGALAAGSGLLYLYKRGFFGWVKEKIKYDVLKMYEKLEMKDKKELAAWRRDLRESISREEFEKRNRERLRKYSPEDIREIVRIEMIVVAKQLLELKKTQSSEQFKKLGKELLKNYTGYEKKQILRLFKKGEELLQKRKGIRVST